MLLFQVYQSVKGFYHPQHFMLPHKVVFLQSIPSLYNEVSCTKIVNYVNQTDLKNTLSLTPASSFGPPDMATIDMTVSTEQPAVTSQVPTQVMTNPSVNATNPFVMNASTVQGASGCPAHHEWV